MSFAVGFLVGSLLLLVSVLYFTRIRGSTVPQAKVVESEELNAGEPPAADSHDSLAEMAPERETCELCNEKRVCQEVSGMTVCSSCEAELL